MNELEADLMEAKQLYREQIMDLTEKYDQRQRNLVKQPVSYICMYLFTKAFNWAF